MNPNRAKVVNADSIGIQVTYMDTYKSFSTPYYKESSLKYIQRTPKVTQIIVNKKQEELYKQATQGLKAYREDQLISMNYVEKNRIHRIFVETQAVLTKWKKELVHDKLGSFIKKYFYKSDFAKGMVITDFMSDPYDNCEISFRDLKIRREHIIEKLVQEGLLPHNFYQL